MLGRRHDTFDHDDHDDDQDDDDHDDHDHDDDCRVDKDKLRARAVAGACGNARRRRITRLAVIIIIFAMVFIIFIVIFLIVILFKTITEMIKTQVLPWSEHHAAPPSFPLMGERFSITI